MWQIVTFFILFQIIFSMANSSILLRSIYALILANHYGWKSFFKFYAESYLIHGHAINNHEPFLPEINSKLERILSEALAGKSFSDIKTNYYDNDIYLYLHNNVEGNNIKFYYKLGKINNQEYILTPSVFFIADKLIKKIEEEEEAKKLKEKKSAI
ncbi:hypothetical protein [Yersinia phage fHe-Yen9-04]|uniref:Uncharacterized protein n=2 Tax=Eneladusvirus Yen904 TaxID=2560849 RepID=A0A2C9CY30_9CAUD|nr:hypothetical protein FDJ41_gp417 [Yersinia phage fHe-Yen9-04]SOK58763.1 hypothetical protein [Yersinia phage fHe-Yen9-04]SOK59298.1 hypothetical protein [Yersinia phage fHe-Yen9-03]VUE36532.1 hypothetical protein [Yersinia phage fHe-Yen9-04]